MIFNGSNVENLIQTTELLGDIQKDTACEFLSEICCKAPNAVIRFEEGDGECFASIYEENRPDEIVFHIDLFTSDYQMYASNRFSTSEIIAIQYCLTDWFDVLLERY